jgi:peroxiredoxin
VRAPSEFGAGGAVTVCELARWSCTVSDVVATVCLQETARFDAEVLEQLGERRVPDEVDTGCARTCPAERARLLFLILPLLADPDHVAAEAYGVWGERKFMGKKYMGIDRSTFLIDSDGNVSKAMRGIKPAGHAGEVLDALPE